MDKIEKGLLEAVADLHDVPAGAYNLRKNGAGAERRSTENIIITPKADKPGIDIFIKPVTKNESLHIPVIVTETGLHDLVYNDFEIGENADVVIVAGCGIHNCGDQDSEHNGIHRFHLQKGARIKYVEKHYGEGDGNGKRILNPVTIVEMEEGSYCEMETVQIRGVDSTHRDTTAILAKDAKIVISEKLLTHGSQRAESDMEIRLQGEAASAQIISRTVGQDTSTQVFNPRVIGEAPAPLTFSAILF